MLLVFSNVRCKDLPTRSFHGNRRRRNQGSSPFISVLLSLPPDNTSEHLNIKIYLLLNSRANNLHVFYVYKMHFMNFKHTTYRVTI